MRENKCRTGRLAEWSTEKRFHSFNLMRRELESCNARMKLKYAQVQRNVVFSYPVSRAQDQKRMKKTEILLESRHWRGGRSISSRGHSYNHCLSLSLFSALRFRMSSDFITLQATLRVTFNYEYYQC